MNKWVAALETLSLPKDEMFHELVEAPCPTPLTVTPEKREEKVAVTLPVEEKRLRRRVGIQPDGTPALHCAVCMLGPECPEYQPNLTCFFNDNFKDVGTRDVDEVVDVMANVLEENVMRLRRYRLVEDIQLGGEPDPKVTALSKVVAQQAKALAEVMQSRKRVTVEARGEGILSKVFGQMIPSSVTVEADTKEIEG